MLSTYFAATVGLYLFFVEFFGIPIANRKKGSFFQVSDKNIICRSVFLENSISDGADDVLCLVSLQRSKTYKYVILLYL